MKPTNRTDLHPIGKSPAHSRSPLTGILLDELEPSIDFSIHEKYILAMTLNIQRARVTLTIEMDYISSTYVMRDYLHILEFFKRVPEIQERFEARVADPDASEFKIVPKRELFCEYLSNGTWVKSN